tara:strand:- start:56 stop:559 length:504 start_codon:yes stop_codon:yes gene_type:complete
VKIKSIIFSIFIVGKIFSQEPVIFTDLVPKDKIFYHPNDFKNPFTGKTILYHENGNLNGTSFLKDGKLHGLSLSYWEDGVTLFMRTNYKNGLEEGFSIWYYPTGIKLKEEFFVDGKREGIGKMFHPNGKILYEIEFKNGLENGYFKEYDIDGILLKEKKYKNGDIVN